MRHGGVYVSDCCVSGNYGKHKCDKETGTKAKALASSSEERKQEKAQAIPRALAFYVPMPRRQVIKWALCKQKTQYYTHCSDTVGWSFWLTWSRKGKPGWEMPQGSEAQWFIKKGVISNLVPGMCKAFIKGEAGRRVCTWNPSTLEGEAASLGVWSQLGLHSEKLAQNN